MVFFEKMFVLNKLKIKVVSTIVEITKTMILIILSNFLLSLLPSNVLLLCLISLIKWKFPKHLISNRYYWRSVYTQHIPSVAFLPAVANVVLTLC